jgi:hypothetical protein
MYYMFHESRSPARYLEFERRGLYFRVHGEPKPIAKSTMRVRAGVRIRVEHLPLSFMNCCAASIVPPVVTNTETETET